MKTFLVLLTTFFLFSCEKGEKNQNEYVDITYEIQTTDTGFTLLRYGNFYALSSGFSGVILEDWTISGTGNFSKTVSIRKGFVAEAMGIHASSNNWNLKIKSSSGNVIASGVPVFIADSNYYYLKISAPSQ